MDIKRMKQEIKADIAAGIVPASVGSFSELHDYVDANCYGGLCDDMRISIEDANDSQNIIDRWLKGGMQE